MGKKVVTLGEIMLRLSTPGNTRLGNPNLLVWYLGAERPTWLSAVPTTDMMLIL